MSSEKIVFFFQIWVYLYDIRFYLFFSIRDEMKICFTEVICFTVSGKVKSGWSNWCKFVAESCAGVEGGSKTQGKIKCTTRTHTGRLIGELRVSSSTGLILTILDRFWPLHPDSIGRGCLLNCILVQLKSFYVLAYLTFIPCKAVEEIYSSNLIS